MLGSTQWRRTYAVVLNGGMALTFAQLPTHSNTHRSVSRRAISHFGSPSTNQSKAPSFAPPEWSGQVTPVLRSIRSIGVAQQRQVSELRYRPLKGTIQHNVFGGRRHPLLPHPGQPIQPNTKQPNTKHHERGPEQQTGRPWAMQRNRSASRTTRARKLDPYLAANDMRHLHEMVVHHVGQMVRGEPVAFDQHLPPPAPPRLSAPPPNAAQPPRSAYLIVHRGVLELDGPAHQIVHLGGPALDLQLPRTTTRSACCGAPPPPSAHRPLT